MFHPILKSLFLPFLIGNGMANFVNPTFSGIYYYLFIGDIGELIPTYWTKKLLAECIYWRTCLNIVKILSIDDINGFNSSIDWSARDVSYLSKNFLLDGCPSL